MSVWIELARQQEAAGTEQREYIDMLGRTAANTEYVGEPLEIERLKAENEQLRRRLGEAQAKADKAIAGEAELRRSISYHIDWCGKNRYFPADQWVIIMLERFLASFSLAEEHSARDRERDEALRWIADHPAGDIEPGDGAATRAAWEMSQRARQALGEEE